MSSALARTVFIAALCLCGQPAFADDALAPLEQPDPASVTVPDMAFKPTERDVHRFDDNYYFYKPGVDYATAFAAMNECRLYGRSVRLFAVPPKFVPLDGKIFEYHLANTSAPYLRFGLVGGLLAAAIVASAEDEATVNTIRRCMHYRGYGRYGTSRAIAEALDQGTEVQSMARRALVAAGPQPQAEALDP